MTLHTVKQVIDLKLQGAEATVQSVPFFYLKINMTFSHVGDNDNDRYLYYPAGENQLPRGSKQVTGSTVSKQEKKEDTAIAATHRVRSKEIKKILI